MSQTRWDPTGTDWEHWIERVVTPGEPLDRLSQQIPPAWRAIMDEGSTEAALRLWSGAERALPLFTTYLRQCLTGVALGDGKLGPVLVYFVNDWYDLGWDGTEEGILVGTVPTPETLLAAFEASHGPLPPSVRAFWERHGFTRLKNDSLLSSLVPPAETLPNQPQVHVIEGRGYLGIADAWRTSSLCLVGEGPPPCRWTDRIVRVYPAEGAVQPRGDEVFDQLLVNWAHREWKPRSI
ncbi:hypothetical protein WMF04_19270 [Sorangium sp. So ce260]|uniref:hypothetical protein n=1 Tax=Sorangium sp. So ce260 TaxID=3133291 RepID=UPI003F600DDC